MFDLSSFKVLIKKLFPPKESVFIVDTTGDGRGDSIQIKFINLLLPFVIPDNFEIGDFNLKSFDINDFDVSEYAKFYIDDTMINIPKETLNLETIQDRFLIYHKGEAFTIKNIIEGNLSGRTIALGDTVSVLIKLDAQTLTILAEGEHAFRIESELVSNLIINFELDETNMNIRFDPMKT
ncbi:MAG: hypothetical protein ACFE8B_06665 [Candidatus Hermodarchaeota archaeon]